MQVFAKAALQTVAVKVTHFKALALRSGIGRCRMHCTYADCLMQEAFWCSTAAENNTCSNSTVNQAVYAAYSLPVGATCSVHDRLYVAMFRQEA